VKYLVDSLQTYETGHGDALRPVQTEADRSFCGDHVLTNMVTAAEVREFATSTDCKLSLLMDTFERITVATHDNGVTRMPSPNYSSIHPDTVTVKASIDNFPKTSSASPSPANDAPAKPLPTPNLRVTNL
jgi:hypothetical protein